jgi:hypothetical protein
MNRELIKKYKAEFEHWLNGGSLLLGQEKPDNTFEWVLPTVITWNNISCTYIIDDEYVEFRKALAEGKTIQICAGGNNYTDVTIEEYVTQYELKGYPLRIKPDEPTFKVGDWVNIEGAGGTFVGKITFIDSNGDLTLDANSVAYASQAELWQPEPDEWCVMKEGAKTNSFSVQKWHEDAKWTPEPFIGTLPTFIEEV